MSSQDVFMVTVSKHFGIQKKAYRTFEEAQAAAVEALVNVEGAVINHASPAECYNSVSQVQPSFTTNWVVGQLPGDVQVGPTMIYKLEL